MPVLPTAEVSKFIELDAPYTSARFAEQLDKLHARSALIRGFEVRAVPGQPSQILVTPGRALIRGVVVEMTAEQLLLKPALALPFILYLDTIDEDDASDTTLDFALPGALPAGAVALAEFSTSNTVHEDRKETLEGRTRGVKARRLQRAALGGQSVFPFDGLHFNPGTDQLFPFVDGRKFQIGIGEDIELNGLRELSLTSGALGEGLLFDLLAHSGIRFLEQQTDVEGDIVATAIPNPYDPSVGDLLVFKNQVLLSPGVDYDQTGANQINVFVDSIATDKWELYGIDGLIYRETFNLAAQTDIDLDFHGYRPGTHALWVFAGGQKLVPTFGYVEESAEKIVLSEPFTGTVEVVVMHSTIQPTDVYRDLGEIFDLGRDLADALIDPDGNRPAATPPSADNPYATVLDVSTNQEVVDARGSFPNLNDRITSAVDGSGNLIAHGANHAQDGSDPIPVATPSVGGLHSADDKAAWDAHLGARGEDEHALALGAPSPEPGFMSGDDKEKMDQINLALLPRGVWAVRFYTQTKPSGNSDPDAFLTAPVKGNNTFFQPTYDGTIPAFQPTSSEPFGFTTRFTMTVDVGVGETIFISMLNVLVSRGRIYITDGGTTEAAIPCPGNGRCEGSFALAAGTGVRIDVVFNKGGSGFIAGTRVSFQTNLLNPGKSVTFVSAP